MERFVTRLIPRRTNPYSYSEDYILGAIVAKKGFDPQSCLYRGFATQRSLEKLAAEGISSDTGDTFCMEIKRSGNTFEFLGDDAVTSPMDYTDGANIAGVAVYDKGKMEETVTAYKWSFKNGVAPKDALLGVVIVTSPEILRRRRVGFERLVRNIRKTINQ